MPAIVTLLTDFGLVDTYVGQLKGAILSVAPSLPLIDLTHQVPAQAVQGRGPGKPRWQHRWP